MGIHPQEEASSQAVESVSSIAPFVVAGSVLPTWTIAVIALLGTARPVSNASAFILGNATFRLLLGAAVLFALPLPDSESFRLDSGVWDARLVVSVGILLVVLAIWVWIRRADERAEQWVERAERITPGVSFAVGFLSVASPGVQYAYLLGGLATIMETIPEASHRILALALFVILLQWMLVLPVVIFVSFRETSRWTLARMKDWLKANGRKLVAGILGLAGAYVTMMGVLQWME